MSAGEVAFRDILRARRAIAGRVRRTPLVPSPSLSDAAGAPVHLKLEHQQITGSFKLRGATNAVLALGAEERARGVVGASTGNHGRGLAYAAKELGVRCIICMSSLVPRNKIDGIRALGAEVRIVGDSQDDAQVEVDRMVAEEGMVLVPPFDQPDIIAGQGTLGREIVEDLPEVETVVVPLSGGGLIAGVALAVKTANPATRVVGVTMDRGASRYESRLAGKPVPVEELASLADALGGGIGLDNRYTFAMVRDLVDDLVLVSEARIAAAVRHAYREEKQVIEGSGAVGIAALQAGLVEDPGTTVVVVSGCNIDMALHQRLIDGEDVDLGSKVETRT
ncbi:MAG: hydroxyectoine utilization dehydratase EutB [Kiloniellales bacterium]